MSKVTITLEDLDNGSLQVKVTPPASEIAKAALQNETSEAQDVAILLISTLRKYQIAKVKEKSESNIINPSFY